MLARMEPSILRTIAANPSPTPGAPAAPVSKDGAPGEKPAVSEPVALADASTAACDGLGNALGSLEDLMAQAEVSESIDPKIEKLIAKAIDLATQAKEAADEAAEALGSARDEHRELVDDDPV